MIACLAITKEKLNARRGLFNGCSFLLESFGNEMDVLVVMEFTAEETDVDVAQGGVGISVFSSYGSGLYWTVLKIEGEEYR